MSFSPSQSRPAAPSSWGVEVRGLPSQTVSDGNSGLLSLTNP